MKEIDEIRCSIDLIDSQLAVLFEARMKEVAKIAKVKSEYNIPIVDSEREKYIREKNSLIVKSDVFRPYFDKFYDNVIALSKEYQKQANEK